MGTRVEQWRTAGEPTLEETILRIYLLDLSSERTRSAGPIVWRRSYCPRIKLFRSNAPRHRLERNADVLCFTRWVGQGLALRVSRRLASRDVWRWNQSATRF